MVQRGKSRPGEPGPYFDQFGYAILRDEYLGMAEKGHASGAETRG